MLETSHTAKETIKQNPIHIDSKWFKEIVSLTGSVEESLLLADTIIYHHNRYKSFKIGNDNLYGLIYSAKEYQKSLNISYHKARELPNKLVEKGLLEAHSKKFMCNRTFYTPTKKALENIYKIHFSAANFDAENGKPVVQIRTTACSDSHNPYKDKNKYKKNNNHNSILKNHSLLENLNLENLENLETVIFNFNKFNISNIQCEANVFDYFTIKQNEVINTIAFCHHEKLDIITFNHILNRNDLKKEAKDFKQLVSWAYFEAVKKNDTVRESDTAKNNDISIESKDEKKSLSKDQSLDSDNNNLKAEALPDITTSDIQDMITQRTQQIEPIKTYLSMTIESETDNVVDALDAKKEPIEKTSELEKGATPHLLNQTNINRLIDSLNSAGIDDEKLIFDIAREIICEYPDLSFQDLLQGVIYRLVTQPEKQKKQDTINQSLMEEFNNIADSKALEYIDTVAANQSRLAQVNDAPLPQLSDLAMPHADTYLLRQDLANKADQNFYTGSLPDSQQLALLAMIDYVKRNGITITIDQDVYEWLYHMASNHKYYYSRAKNFKHWCNIAMKQLMQRRLHKPAWFDSWRSRIEADSFSVAA